MRIGSAPRRRCIKAIGVGGVAATAENIFPPNEGRVLSSGGHAVFVTVTRRKVDLHPVGVCVCSGLEIRSFTWQEDFSSLVDNDPFVQIVGFGVITINVATLMSSSALR